jgi:1,6-anhydro-N-acetylmuramate kinase
VRAHARLLSRHTQRPPAIDLRAAAVAAEGYGAVDIPVLFMTAIIDGVTDLPDFVSYERTATRLP